MSTYYEENGGPNQYEEYGPNHDHPSEDDDNSSTYSGSTESSTPEDPPYSLHPIQVSTPEHALKAAQTAAKASKRLSRDSRVLDKRKEESLPRFRMTEEIVLGKLLGRGGFSNVCEISDFQIPPVEEDRKRLHVRPDHWKNPTIRAKHEYRLEARQFLRKHCKREKTGDNRYAVKFLRPDVMTQPKRFQTGAADLAVEAKFLASLEHPNIIKLRGVTDGGVNGFAGGMEGGYFLILDRLYDTLEDRIEHWSSEYRMNTSKHAQDDRGEKKKKKRRGRRTISSVLSGGANSSSASSAKKRHQARMVELLAERLHVAFDIAGALKYLHSLNVVYRDLKPENVGFDVRGDVKLFDLGLAKELDSKKKLADDTYELSGKTGSLRYMAPEVAMSEPYNLSADVYSFGTMLWEMIALCKPYEGFNRKMHSDLVVYGNVRPDIHEAWPFPLRSLIGRSWSSDLNDRPTMEGAYVILRKLVMDLRGGDAEGLEHVQRRSTYVLQKQISFSSRSSFVNSVGGDDRNQLDASCNPRTQRAVVA